MQFQLKDIQPNPFRNIDRYPIRRDKIEALKKSIETTGFWDNIVAREVEGKPEIAYGHHRLVALREVYPKTHKIDLIVRDFDDAIMLKVMAAENMEEWGSSAAVEHETIKAVVEAYAKGKIQLPAPSKDTPKTQLRDAPSFIMGNVPAPAPARPYTAGTIAIFLGSGWITTSGTAAKRVTYALGALELIELKLLKESVFTGLTTSQAEAVVIEARKAKEARDAAAEAQRAEAEREARSAERASTKEARERAEARSRTATTKADALAREGRDAVRRVGMTVSNTLKSGGAGYKEAGKVARKVDTNRPKPEKIPNLNDLARRLATKVNRYLNKEQDSSTINLLDTIVEYEEGLSASARAEVVKALGRLITRAARYQSLLEKIARLEAN